MTVISTQPTFISFVTMHSLFVELRALQKLFINDQSISNNLRIFILLSKSSESFVNARSFAVVVVALCLADDP